MPDVPTPPETSQTQVTDLPERAIELGAPVTKTEVVEPAPVSKTTHAVIFLRSNGGYSKVVASLAKEGASKTSAREVVDQYKVGAVANALSKARTNLKWTGKQTPVTGSLLRSLALDAQLDGAERGDMNLVRLGVSTQLWLAGGDSALAEREVKAYNNTWSAAETAGIVADLAVPPGPTQGLER